MGKCSYEMRLLDAGKIISINTDKNEPEDLFPVHLLRNCQGSLKHIFMTETLKIKPKETRKSLMIIQL